MLIYQNNLDKFRQDVVHNRIADIMKDNFEGSFGRRVTPSEYQSWGNSSQHVRNVLDLAGLNDNMICMEYEVPYNTGRIDCMIFGKGEDGKSYAVLLELKQWSRVEEIEDEDNYQVETFTGGDLRKVAHPSQQVGAYHSHLLSFVQIFETDQDFCLNSSAYCHNYQKVPGQGLFAERYAKIVEQFPIYTKADVEILAQKLKHLLSKGSGFEIFNRFMQSRIQPSKKLLENASKIIDDNQAVFSLLNEQLVAKNVIMAKVRSAEKKKTKSVIIVHGGPGTGKTVIAVNVLADLARRNKTVFYGCKSKPFSEALKKVVGTDSKILFSNLTRFVPSKVQEDSIDVVLIDEAHRIGKTSNSQYTPSEDRTDMPQIDQLIRCAKTAVFFIDDAQIVRSQEVGSSALIREAAEKFKAGYEDVQLISQFRCAGSDNYLDWIEYVLGYKEKPADFSKDDRFEFKIFSDPNALYAVIKQQEAKKANSARMVAGYCWPWSKELNEDGTLVKDVFIAEHNFAMPWEAQDDYPGGRKLQKGIPKWYQWAYNTRGVEQVGCIYTVQGFEFDYVGVIIGPDLKYDKKSDRLVCDVSATADPTLRKDAKNFETYAKNIYRVLMSRGMKGCYVYFCDKEVEAYFRKNIKGDPSYQKPLVLSDVVDNDAGSAVELKEEKPLFFKDVISDGSFDNGDVPIYDLQAVATSFREQETPKVIGWKPMSGKKTDKDLFIAQVVGESMEPTIANGSWCLFRFERGGSRNGLVVLVESRQVKDPETGLAFTIKRYHSHKEDLGNGQWRHKRIVLSPDNKKFQDIVLENVFEGDFRVVAKFVGILSLQGVKRDEAESL